MSNISLTKYSKSESLENKEFSVPKILDSLIKFSIDQNSTRIEIKIERNGLTLIEIRNNGIGMSSKDLEDSIKGHSNILNDKNIFLDISKISKLEIISKERDKTRGSLLKITNDKIMPIKQCYADIGTKVSLKDFFYNNHKERVNPENFIEEDIKKIIFNYAVTFPKIDFFVSLNKKIILEAPIEDELSKDKIISRIGNMFNKKIAKSLIKEEFETEEIGIQVYYSNTTELYKKNNNQFIIVNNRPENFREIKTIFNDLYTKSFEVDRYPYLFVFLSYDENAVEKNKVEKILKSLLLRSFAKQIYKIIETQDNKKNSINSAVNVHEHFQIIESKNGIIIKNIKNNKKVEISISNIQRLFK